MIDRQQLAEAGFTSNDAGTTWTKNLPESGAEIRCHLYGCLLPPAFIRDMTISGREMTICCNAQESDTAESMAKLLDFDFIMPDGCGAIDGWSRIAKRTIKDFLTRRIKSC